MEGLPGGLPDYLTLTLREHKIRLKIVRLHTLREHIAYYEVEKHT